MSLRATTIAMSLSLTTMVGAQVELGWTLYHNGPGNGSDQFWHVMVDADGTILVAGEETVGSSDTDLVLMRLDADGNEIWKEIIDGPGNDSVTAMAMTPGGSVVLAGHSYVSGPPNPVLTTTQIDGNGAIEWSDSFAATGTNSNYADDVAVDALGNVYVSGQATISTGNMLLLKYDASGILQWERQFDGAGSWDSGRLVDVDDDGNVVMVGKARFGDDDVAILKYDADGDLLWSQIYGPDGISDHVQTMDIASDGAVVIGGKLGDALFVTKFSADGDMLWEYTYSSPNDGFDYVRTVVLDDADNVHMAGMVTSDPGGRDQLTMKFDADGNVLWSRVDFDDPDVDTSDTAEDLQLDAAGNVYTTGYGERGISGVSGDDPEVEWGVRTMSFGPDGSDRWSLFTVTDDTIYSIAVAPDGRVYGAGHVQVDGQGDDQVLYGYVPVLVDCNGNGVHDPDEIANGTAPDCNGNGVPDECDMADGTSNDCDGDGTPDECQIADDPSLDLDASGILDSCEAVGDLDGSGDTGTGDLLMLLGQWGCTDDCTADLNGDGVADVTDLILLLGMWG